MKGDTRLEMRNWFEIRKIDKWVHVIREKWVDIDQRFYTHYTNLYLLSGEKKSLLLDTGMGVYSIKETITPLVREKELMVFNSHHHFDHVAGNIEFKKIFVHKFDLKLVSKTRDISFLAGIKTVASKHYEKQGFKVKSADEFYPVEDEEEFDLGGLKVTVLHTPGHTKGSISLATDKGHLFTADTVHEGAVFLPPKENLSEYMDTLEKLERLVNNSSNSIEFLFPGHERYGLPIKLISVLKNRIIENVLAKDLKKERYDEFLEARIIRSDPFVFVVPISKDESYTIE